MYVGIFMLIPKESDPAERLLPLSGGMAVISVSSLFPAPPICLFVLSSDVDQLPRTVRMLNSAAYPKSLFVDLIIVNSMLNTTEGMNWSHGHFYSEKHLRHTNHSSTIVIVIDDTMEVSPFFAYWFLLQRNVSVVVGGNTATGFAVDGVLWNKWFQTMNGDQPTVIGLLLDFTLLCDCDVVFPLLSDGRVFVRNAFQSPVEPETFPKLVRAWNFKKEQWDI
jgi:hypothetical protein